MKKILVLMMVVLVGTLCGCKNPAQIVATQAAGHVARQAIKNKDAAPAENTKPAENAVEEVQKK